jgi:hypothetical protein
LALKTSTSGEYRFVEGQLRRSKKFLAIRGLNTNHNHDLKNIFKGAATRAAAVPGPFQEFHAGLVARGMKPTMGRLTLARKIAAITLIVWKKGTYQALASGIQELVADELAAAAGENRWTPNQARPLLRAVAGGESPHAAAAWEHAGKDCGTPFTNRIDETVDRS